MWASGLWTRNYNSSFGSWVRLLDSSNYGGYSTFTGAGTFIGITAIITDSSSGDSSVILHKYGGVNKVFSGYSGSQAIFGGEAGVPTRLQAGGQYALTALANGNIGIGITSPVVKLHVYNSAAADTYLESGTSGTTGKLIFKTSDNADLNKYIMQESYYMILNGHANEGFKFRDSNGNVLLSIFGAQNAYASRVGIGTITPSAKLHIYNGSSHFEATSTGAAVLSSGLYALQIGPLHDRLATAGTYYGGIAFNHLLNYTGGTAYNVAPQAWIGTRLQDTAGSERDYLVFATKPGTGTSGAGNDIPIERMCIDRDGLVGIGTTSPSAKLHVSGAYPQLILNNPAAGSGTYILFQDNGTAGGFIGHQNSTNKLQFSSTNASVAHMTIDSGGNVGIGTTGPVYKLDVTGTGRFTGDLTVGALVGTANSATMYANTGSYGSWKIGGTRNGWYGIEFEAGTNLMMNNNEVGFYKPANGWLFRWYNGNCYISKGGSGGGTEGVILDSSNVATYALPISGIPSGSDQYVNFRVIRNSNASGPDGMYIGYGNGNSGRTRIYGDGSTSGYIFPDASGNLFRSDGATYIHSSNYTSYPDATKLPLAGGALTGTLSIDTSGTGVTSTVAIKRSGQGVVNFGSYAGSWRSALQIQSNANDRMLFFVPPEADYQYGVIRSVNGGLKIDVGGTTGNGGGNAISIETSGAVSMPGTLNVVGAVTQNGNQVLHAGNYIGSYIAKETSYTTPINASGYSWVRIPYAAGYSFNDGQSPIEFYVTRSIFANGSSPYGGPTAKFIIQSMEWHSGQQMATVQYGERGDSASLGAANWITHAKVTNLAGGGYWVYLRLRTGTAAGITYYIRRSAVGGQGLDPSQFEVTTDPGGAAVLYYGFNLISAGNEARFYRDGNQVLDAGNFSSYALPLTGGTLTGTITATNFSGPGSNLTGTASSLTAGSANAIADGVVSTTAKLANSVVTYAKIQNVTAYTVLGNSNPSAAQAPVEISMATLAGMVGSQYTTSIGNVLPDRVFMSNDANIKFAPRDTAKAHLGLTGKYGNSRPNITADTSYWTGSMGWGTTDWNSVFDWGSGFTDSWSSPANNPGDTSHHLGIQSVHYTNGSARYGWQMVNGVATNRWWLRDIWGGGFSAWREIIHSGNIASQTVATAGSCTGNAASATTAGNVNGYSTSAAVGANTIVIRDSAGYIYAHYLNTNVSESENPSINSFFTSNGDGWLRKSTVAHVKYTLSLSGTNSGDQTNISGSSGSCTGNAASVTDGVYLSTNQYISGVKTFSAPPVATNIAKAWVHYNMYNNTINASYNVSSVTDNGAGVCTVNFSSAMVDANYVVAGTATYDYDNQDIHTMVLAVPRRSTAQQAGSCRLATEYMHAAAVYDSVAVRAVFYR